MNEMVPRLTWKQAWGTGNFKALGFSPNHRKGLDTCLCLAGAPVLEAPSWPTGTLPYWLHSPQRPPGLPRPQPVPVPDWTGRSPRVMSRSLRSRHSGG